MWIWIIIIAVLIGAIIGFAQNGEKEDAMGGAMAGGCLAASCLGGWLLPQSPLLSYCGSSD